MSDPVAYSVLMTLAFEIAKKLDRVEEVREIIKNEKKEPDTKKGLRKK